MGWTVTGRPPLYWVTTIRSSGTPFPWAPVQRAASQAGCHTHLRERSGLPRGDFCFDSDRRCHDFTPDRGPGKYTSFTDLYGHTVTVRYSSLATSAAVWIFTHLPHEQQVKLALAGLDPSLFTGSAHLCRAMAREVRDALTAFLDEPVDDELACETRTPRIVAW